MRSSSRCSSWAACRPEALVARLLAFSGQAPLRKVCSSSAQVALRQASNLTGPNGPGKLIDRKAVRHGVVL